MNCYFGNEGSEKRFQQPVTKGRIMTQNNKFEYDAVDTTRLPRADHVTIVALRYNLFTVRVRIGGEEKLDIAWMREFGVGHDGIGIYNGVAAAKRQKEWIENRWGRVAGAVERRTTSSIWSIAAEAQRQLAEIERRRREICGVRFVCRGRRVKRTAAPAVTTRIETTSNVATMHRVPEVCIPRPRTNVVDAWRGRRAIDTASTLKIGGEYVLVDGVVVRRGSDEDVMVRD